MILLGQEMLRDDAREISARYDASTRPIIISVADGMGGHKGGAAASEFVAAEMGSGIALMPLNLPLPELKEALKNIIASIHIRLNEDGQNDPEKTGMGSTFAGLLFYSASVFLINIGDSRIYRFRDGILSQFSRDHTLRAMTNNPDIPNNILANCLGGGANLFFDFEDITPRIMTDDLILICSDGLTGELTDAEIETFLTQSPNAAPLVAAARNNTGSDNISVIIIKFSN
jgi:protein phosphatase